MNDATQPMVFPAAERARAYARRLNLEPDRLGGRAEAAVAVVVERMRLPAHAGDPPDAYWVIEIEKDVPCAAHGSDRIVAGWLGADGELYR